MKVLFFWALLNDVCASSSQAEKLFSQIYENSVSGTDSKLDSYTANAS